MRVAADSMMRHWMAAVPALTMTPDQLRRRRWLTVVVMMATIMQALDGTIANVALPNMQGIAVGDPGAGRLGITSYIVSAAIATPLAGFWRCASACGASWSRR